jgi:hypothetical protein
VQTLRPALPHADGRTAGHVRRADADTVTGIACPKGHLNHPGRRHCSACGTALIARHTCRTSGPRPVVGMLLGAQGLRTPMSVPFLIVVRDAEQQPICVPLHDEGPSLLRVHVQFQGWDPYLLAESAGAQLTRPGVGARAPLPIGIPTALVDGCTLRLSRGVLRYAALVPDHDPTTGSGGEPAPRSGHGRHRARSPRLPDRAVFPRRGTW